MPTINATDFYYIAPEIALTVCGLVVLMADVVWLRRASSARRQRVLGWLSLLGVVATFGVWIGNAHLYLDLSGGKALSPEPDPLIFFGLIAGDTLTFWMNLVILLMLGLVIAISMAWPFTEHWGEYFALLFWAAVGMMLLIASEELLTLFLTLETMTLCLYLSTAFETG